MLRDLFQNLARLSTIHHHEWWRILASSFWRYKLLTQIRRGVGRIPILPRLQKSKTRGNSRFWMAKHWNYPSPAYIKGRTNEWLGRNVGSPPVALWTLHLHRITREPCGDGWNSRTHPQHNRHFHALNKVSQLNQVSKSKHSSLCFYLLCLDVLPPLYLSVCYTGYVFGALITQARTCIRLANLLRDWNFPLNACIPKFLLVYINVAYYFSLF